MRTIIFIILAWWIIYPATAQDNCSCETAELIEPSAVSRIYSKEIDECWYQFVPKQGGFYVLEPIDHVEVYMGTCSDLQYIESGFRPSTEYGHPTTFYGEKGKTYYFKMKGHARKQYNETETWKFYESNNELLKNIRQIIVNEPVESNIGYTLYEFKPTLSQEGYYSTKILRDNGIVRSIRIYTGSPNNLKWLASSNSHYLYFYAQSGKTYYIQWHDHVKAREGIYAPFPPEKQLWQLHKIDDSENWHCRTVRVITPSDSIETSDNKYNWFRFTPQESNGYIIKSSERQSTWGKIYTGSCNELKFYRHIDEPFYLYAEAGKTYYFKWGSYIKQGKKWTWSMQKTDANLICKTAWEVIPSDSIITINPERNDPLSFFSARWFRFVPKSGQEGYYTAEGVGTFTLYVEIGMGVGHCDSIQKISSDILDAVTFYAQSGKTYYIHYSCPYENQPRTWSFNKTQNPIKLTRETAQEISVSDTIVADRRGDNWYKFTIKEDGLYTMKPRIGSILNETDSSVFVAPSYLLTKRGFFWGQAGREYYIRIHNSSTKPCITKIYKETEGSHPLTAITVNPSEEKIKTNNNGERWYSFIPTAEQSGRYTIYSNNKHIHPTILCSSCFDGNHPVTLDGLTYNVGLTNPKIRPTSFFALEGKTYHIIWEKTNKDFEWSLQKTTENIICDNAAMITDFDNIKADYTNNWYYFTPNEDAVYYLVFNSTKRWVNNIIEGNCGSSNYKAVNISDWDRGHNFYAKAGKVYRIGIKNHSDTTQFWSLKKIENPEGCVCETAKTVFLSDNIPSVTKNQTSNWHIFTPTESGYYEISQNKTEADKRYFSVYTGSCDHDSLKEVYKIKIYSDSGCKDNSTFRFYAQADTKYYIYWQGKISDNWTWNLKHFRELIDK